MQYSVLLFHDPAQGGYGVMVPALPGCFNQGDPFEGALANARESIAGHSAALHESGEDVPVEDEAPVLASVEIPQLESARR